jgi:DNA polymerase I
VSNFSFSPPSACDHLGEDIHSFLIVEHDPLLYEDAGEMVEYISQALKQTSREATILLYSPARISKN